MKAKNEIMWAIKHNAAGIVYNTFARTRRESKTKFMGGELPEAYKCVKVKVSEV